MSNRRTPEDPNCHKARCLLQVKRKWFATEGFKTVTWNFSEKAHGKGAPDGVGATVKRLADTTGKDLQIPEDVYDFLIKQKSTINFYWISKEDVEKFDEKVPELVPAVGTMNSVQRHFLLLFETSSHLPMLQSIDSRFQKCLKVPEPPSLNQKGKLIFVNYEGKPFVGPII
ncbi:hypothetical protein UPYG_G00341190 [Umbra pygmaea]|uniref:Uncharacterized protein n=1 Tax=Umbra pygmaea TaxID=75934 RepID=A0ABD0VX17_UMBPY